MDQQKQETEKSSMVLRTEGLVKIYRTLNIELKGNVAVKLHSGEDGNQNYVKPEFVRDLIEYVKGTVVECNTAYEGARNSTKKHELLMEKHGWNKYYQVDTTHSSEGNVIGLSIVKHIVDLHLGEIEVNCEKGKTTFRVILPM